jgi:hypothetical protein
MNGLMRLPLEGSKGGGVKLGGPLDNGVKGSARKRQRGRGKDRMESQGGGDGGGGHVSRRGKRG